MPGDGSFEIVVRQVCAGCNNGWLHDLERAFRAVMEPVLGKGTSPIALSPGSQLVVATWAVKTWFLFELARPDEVGGRTLNGRPILHELCVRSRPPSTIGVWMGAVAGRVKDQVSVHVQPVVDGAGGFVGVLGVLQIGPLLLLIYIARGTEDDASTFHLGVRSTSFEQIWPHQIKEIRWPPMTVLAIDDLSKWFPTGENLVVP